MVSASLNLEMYNSPELPRIDRYTCKFENPVLEEQYMGEQWSRVKKALNFAFGLMSLVMLVDFYEAYGRMGGFKPIQLGFLVIISLVAFFVTRSDTFKSKYFSIFMTSLFCGIHSFQMLQTFIIPNDQQVDIAIAIASIPTIFMFVGILFPVNLIQLVGVLLFLIITIIPLIPGSGIDPGMLIFALPLPFIMLVWNKYRSEYNNRLNFAKTVSIDQTKNLMQQTLKRYFGDVLSEKMIKEDGGLTGENKWVTLSFTDISAYSTIIEHMSPKVAVEFLNEYFTAMHDVIEEFNGHILNYIGDSVMVVYGAPEELKDHELQAVKCALKMREKLIELKQKWDENELSRYWKNHGIDTITARTGIHTGSIIAGNIGSERMLQYSTIGDVVNVASRLEQANKEFETNIAFSQEIFTALTKDLNNQSQLSGEITLKGRTSPTKVYSI